MGNNYYLSPVCVSNEERAGVVGLVEMRQVELPPPHFSLSSGSLIG